MIKLIGGVFWVRLQNGGIEKCSARGVFRIKDGIIPGDNVEVVLHNGEHHIKRILPRKNQLVRPFIANVDQIIIVLAQRPAPDLLLVDKLILSCVSRDITPVVCINKSDESDAEFYSETAKAYTNVCTVMHVSAVTGENISLLKEAISNKFSTFAGQSAVGKTSLLASITGLELITGELSRKTERGKHTTRHTEIFVVDGVNALIADTPGFSILTPEISDGELLWEFYPDFINFSWSCQFRDCRHEDEPNCAVKAAVSDGGIDAGRYQRYIRILQEVNTLKDRYI